MNDEAFLQLPAHDLELSPSVSPKVGEVLSFSLKDAPPDLSVQPQKLKEEPQEGWEIRWDESTKKLEGIPVKAGSLTIPSLPLVDASGKTVARTNPFTIEVLSSLNPKDPAAQQPAPPRGPMGLPFPWWLPVVGGVILLAFLGTVIFLLRKFIRRKPKPAPTLPAAPPKPEDEVALAKLAEIERSPFLREGKYKVYYFAVSETLKTYLGARYKFDASESTSSEIITYLEEKRRIEDTVLDEIERIFDQLDIVKFTDHVPVPEVSNQLLKDSRALVLQTRRVPEPAPIGGR